MHGYTPSVKCSACHLNMSVYIYVFKYIFTHTLCLLNGGYAPMRLKRLLYVCQFCFYVPSMWRAFWQVANESRNCSSQFGQDGRHCI